MKTIHDILQQPGFSPLDRVFAKFIARRQKDNSILLPLAAAWVSRQLARGHVCLDLSRTPRTEPGEESEWPSLDEWKMALQNNTLVGTSDEFKPFLLEGHRLYLQRYRRYEYQLASEILRRGAQRPSFNPVLLRDGLRRYFPKGSERQALAGFASVARSLLILSGGPGTGKTTTALRMLALLQEQTPSIPLRFILAAPTGKAAVRLADAMRNGIEALSLPEILRQNLPQKASTLHRVLGPSKNKKYSLPADVILVDEASMVDLPLMARMFEAIPESARVILLGDQEQLASVEVGSVLRDLVRAAGGDGEWTDLALIQEYEKVRGASWSESLQSHGSPHPLSGNLVVLRENYRFGNESQIYQVCDAVRKGNASRALKVLRSMRTSEVAWMDLPERASLGLALKPMVKKGFDRMLRASGAIEALASLQTFRVLTPLREGPFGLHELNALIEKLLEEAGFLKVNPGPYAGLPILVTRNDPMLQLFNGDLGIFWPDDSIGGKLAAWFEDDAGGIRRIPPINLPPYEKAFAMTIHKSQGSECDEALVILPGRDLPILTREWIYTALSRAKKRVSLWGREDVFSHAVCRRIERHSGLEERLMKQ